MEFVAGARQTSELNMLQWFSRRISFGRSPWADFFAREQRAGGWAYRPKTAVAPPIAPDLELSAIEGDPRMFFHIRRERDRTLAQAKRDAMRSLDGQLTCEACGFMACQVYPGLSGEVCEIHHRPPFPKSPPPLPPGLKILNED